LVRELTKKLNALMKEAGMNVTDPAKQLKSSLDAIKTRLSNQIEDLDKAIATRTPMTSVKGSVPYDAEATALKAQRDEIKARYDEMFPAAPMTDEQRLEIAVKATQRSLDAWEAKVAAAERGEFPGKADKADQPSNAVLEGLKGQRDAMRAEFDRLYDLANPGMSPEERALKNYKAALARSTAQYQDRIIRGDFAKKEKPDRPMDAEAHALKLANDKIKEKFQNLLRNYRKANSPWTHKVGGQLAQPFNVARSILSSFDLSAMLRQGLFIGMAHPLRSASSFMPMLKAFKSEYSSYLTSEDIHNRPNAGLYRLAKLDLTEYEDGSALNDMEETFASTFARKFPGVVASQRAYTTFLNKLRADSFDEMVKAFTRGTPTMVELQTIASYINIATGRGDLGKAAVAGEAMSVVFWSPRLLWSRFQLLGGQPIYHGTAATRTLIAKDYGRFMTGMALVYLLGMLFGGDEEIDPRSSDFGKIKFGNTRLDPLAGMSQVIVLVARSVSGQTKSSSGEVTALRGPGTPYGSGEWDVLTRFLRSKFSPMVGTLVNIDQGKTVVGEKVTPLTTARDMLIPLSVRDVYDVMRENGVAGGTAIMTLGILGVGVQNYGRDEYKSAVKSVQFANKQIAAAKTANERTALRRDLPWIANGGAIAGMTSVIRSQERDIKGLEGRLPTATESEAKSIRARIDSLNAATDVRKQKVVSLVRGR
jgi:hypothetical protein